MAVIPLDPRMPPQKLWSVAEYMRLVDLGVLGPDDKVELLEGLIVEKMPQNFPHIFGVRALIAALRVAYGSGYDVNAQLPVGTPDSAPEPDALVLRGSYRDFAGRFPTSEEVVLVGEVADDSRLAYDRTTKLGIYSRAGFSEYWIVNLVDRRLEVHRRPLPGGGYGDVQYYEAGERVGVAGNSAAILVADLLPPSESSTTTAKAQ